MLLSPILKDVRTWLIVGLVVLAGIVYYQRQEINSLKDAAVIVEATNKQNTAALQDSLHKLADSVQVTAAKVADLNMKNTNLKTQKRLLLTKYNLLLASVVDSGHSVVVDSVDSIGTYKSVKFHGRKYFVSYIGWTKAYITPLSTARWYIDLTFDTLQTRSELLFNTEIGLFQIRTTSLTAGLKLIGYTTIDSIAFPSLYRMNNQPVHPPDFFYVGGMASHDLVSLGVGIKPFSWLFVFNYTVFNRLAIDSQAWYDRVQVGIYYPLF